MGGTWNQSGKEKLGGGSMVGLLWINGAVTSRWEKLHKQLRSSDSGDSLQNVWVVRIYFISKMFFGNFE